MQNNKLRRMEHYNILETVKEIQIDKHKMSRPKLSTKYLQLQQEHPKLYKLAIRDKDLSSGEMKLLEQMLDKRECVRDGIITLEQANDNIATKIAQEIQPDLLRRNT